MTISTDQEINMVQINMDPIFKTTAQITPQITPQTTDNHHPHSPRPAPLTANPASTPASETTKQVSIIVKPTLKALGISAVDLTMVSVGTQGDSVLRGAMWER